MKTVLLLALGLFSAAAHAGMAPLVAIQGVVEDFNDQTVRLRTPDAVVRIPRKSVFGYDEIRPNAEVVAWVMPHEILPAPRPNAKTPAAAKH